MTIRFLRQWNGYDDQDIVNLGSTEESRLVGLGIATYQTNAIKSGPVFDSVSDLPPAIEFVGVAQVGNLQLTSNGRWYEDQFGKPYLPLADTTAKDVTPRYDIALNLLQSTVARSGAHMTVEGSRASDLTGAAGTRLEWDAGLGLTDGEYISVTYLAETPMNLSDIDRLLFEFTHDSNWMDSRLYIIVSSANNLTNAHRFNYANSKKPSAECLMITKAQFGAPWTGTGVDWSSVLRVDFRFTKHGAQNSNQRASMSLRRMAFGGRTHPMILMTHDDNATQLYDAWNRNRSLGLYFDIAVTDYELPTEDNHSSVKCTLAQDKELAAAGYRFIPHNIDHRSFAQVITSYTRVGDAVAITIAPYGGNTEDDTAFLPVAGEYVIIDDSKAEQLNGRWLVDSITPGSHNTTSSIINITVAGASFDAPPSSNDGATLTVEKYNPFSSDIPQLKQMIHAAGLPTSDRYLSLTYGYTSSTSRTEAAKAGFVLIRSMTGTNTQPDFDTTNQVFQIDRRFGMGGVSNRMLALPSQNISTLSALQDWCARLIEVGGVLCLNLHGDESGMTDQIIDDCFAYLASLRDAGTVDLVNFSQLEAHINARRA